MWVENIYPVCRSPAANRKLNQIKQRAEWIEKLVNSIQREWL